jgi:hypothetical protein
MATFSVRQEEHFLPAAGADRYNNLTSSRDQDNGHAATSRNRHGTFIGRRCCLSRRGWRLRPPHPRAVDPGMLATTRAHSCDSPGARPCLSIARRCPYRNGRFRPLRISTRPYALVPATLRHSPLEPMPTCGRLASPITYANLIAPSGVTSPSQRPSRIRPEGATTSRRSQTTIARCPQSESPCGLFWPFPGTSRAGL